MRFPIGRGSRAPVDRPSPTGSRPSAGPENLLPMILHRIDALLQLFTVHQLSTLSFLSKAVTFLSKAVKTAQERSTTYRSWCKDATAIQHALVVAARVAFFLQWNNVMIRNDNIPELVSSIDSVLFQTFYCHVPIIFVLYKPLFNTHPFLLQMLLQLFDRPSTV